MRSTVRRLLATGLLAGSLLAPAYGCGPKTVAVKPTGPTLYDRLGGRQSLAAVVADFTITLRADDRLRGRFAGVADWQDFGNKLVDQLCAAAGGPCTYTGRDMKTTHQGMAVTSAEFDAFVEDLRKTLEKFKVSDQEAADLLATLAPLKADIASARGARAAALTTP
jgi:hemoglobin